MAASVEIENSAGQTKNTCGETETGKERRTAVRPASNRPKMPLSQRAKQFAPYNALSGLGERLKRAEEEHSREFEAARPVHVKDSEE